MRRSNAAKTLDAPSPRAWKKTLRPYQRMDVARIEAARKRVRSIIFSAWMGTGKTHTYVALVLKAVEAGRRVLILVHMKTLLEQTYRRLTQAGLSPDQISVVRGKDVRFRVAAPVQLASAQTMLRRNPNELGRIDEIYLDEGHHYVAKNAWGKILNRYPKASIVAPTATPARGDGKPLVGTFDLMVESVLSVDRAVADEWLMAPEIWTREGWTPDVSGIKKVKGDFEQGALGKRMAAINICGRLVEHWKEKAEGRPTIGFAVNTALAEQYARRFNKAGIRAEVVLGDTPLGKRSEIFERLANGDTKVVWTCNVIGEGWDAPYVRCLIDATPTMSIVRNLQRWGRVMRVGDATPIILDHAGNWLRFGFPHTPREWELPKPVKGEPVEDHDRWVLPREPKKKLVPSVKVDASGRVIAMTEEETSARVRKAIARVKKRTGTKLLDAEITALIEKQARRWEGTIVGALVDESELERLVRAEELARPLPCAHPECNALATAISSAHARVAGTRPYCAAHRGGPHAPKPRLTCAAEGCGRLATKQSSDQARWRGRSIAYCEVHTGGRSAPGELCRCSVAGCGRLATRRSSSYANRTGKSAYCDLHKGGPRMPLAPCVYPGCSSSATPTSSEHARLKGTKPYCTAHRNGTGSGDGKRKPLLLLPCSFRGCRSRATKTSSQHARHLGTKPYCDAHKGGPSRHAPRLRCAECGEPATAKSSNGARSRGRTAAYCEKHKGGSRASKPLLPCAVCGRPATKNSCKIARKKGRDSAYCAKHKYGRGRR